VLTIPNYLSIIRIILIPIFLFYFVEGDYYLSGLFFAISGITDFLDGYIARKFNQCSKLGKILDPLADKLTIICILFVLIMMNIIPRVISIILISREIFIFIASSTTYLLGLNFINPSKLGKTSMFLLYLAIAIKLLELPYVDLALFYIVIPLNIYSAIDYSIKAYHRLYN